MHTCPVAHRQTVAACNAERKLPGPSRSYQQAFSSCLRDPYVLRLRPASRPDRRACVFQIKAASGNGAQLVPAKKAAVTEKEGPSTDFKVIWSRLWKVQICPKLFTVHHSSCSQKVFVAVDTAILDKIRGCYESKVEACWCCSADFRNNRCQVSSRLQTDWDIWIIL